MSEALRVVHLVDDDPSYLTATSRMLRAGGFAIAAFSSARKFLDQLGPGTRGCVVADLHMPELSGLDLQAALAHAPNPLPVIFLTGAGTVPSSVRAMRGGAEDFLEKRAPKQELIAAVQRALDRDAREYAARLRMLKVRARFDALTERELEVLGHVVRGRMNKEIASDLGIHERTVKLHRTAITTKVGVPSVAELTTLAREACLFDESNATFPKGQ